MYIMIEENTKNVFIFEFDNKKSNLVHSFMYKSDGKVEAEKWIVKNYESYKIVNY